MSGRPTIVALVCALLLAACSESSLADLGGRSSDWIGESESSGAAGPVIEQQDVVRAVEVDWVNDQLSSLTAVGTPEEVLAGVVERSTGPDRYLQATRLEIAGTLPGVAFPDLLPTEVVAVTSQLVVGADRETLDPSTFAAFGLWTVEPYSKSRSVGQRGTLTVASLQQESACERFAAGAAGACTSETIGPYTTTRIDADSGQTWVWFDDAYEYQLFLRGSLESNGPVADFMIRNEVPFATVADPSARVLGTQVTAAEESGDVEEADQ